ncbi:MAG: DUF6449 domain-containing protein [Lachnospiraceae bacterium]|nr:DUF6449 domain-containing protein [Lachnospiraceae bacterium]
MISKNSFLVKLYENIKRRIWLPFLMLIVQLFEFPVAATIAMNQLREYTMMAPEALEREMRYSLEIVLGFSPVSAIIAIIFGVLAAIQGFGYLYSRKKVDLYHSVPVTKKSRFGVICLNSLLCFAVTHAICEMLGAVIVAGFGHGDLGFFTHVLIAVLLNCISFLAGFAVAAVGVMLTGNLVVTVLGTAVIGTYEAIYYVLLFGEMRLFFEHYSGYSPLFTWLTKFWISPGLLAFRIMVDLYGAALEMTCCKEMLAQAGYILWLLVLIVLYLAAAYVLYHIRPSEAAGKAMAFSKSKPWIKVFIMIPMSLAFSCLFYILASNTMGFLIFGIGAGILLSHMLIEIIYEFDVRAVFHHWIGTGIASMITVVIICAFVFDLTGYDSYVADPAEVESAALTLAGNTDTLYGSFYDEDMSWMPVEETILNRMTVSDVSAICTLAENSLMLEEETVDQKGMYPGTVKYHLKNGKDVYRTIYLDYNEQEELLNRIFTSEEYYTAAYQLFSEDFEENISAMSYRYSSMRETSQGQTTDVDQLYEVYRADLANRSFQELRDEVPCGVITFAMKSKDQNDDLWDWSYPVYVDFTETRAFLESKGIVTVTTLNTEEINKIEVFGPDTYTEDQEYADNYSTWEEWEFTDPSEITEIADYIYSDYLMQYSLLGRTSAYYANVYYEGKGEKYSDYYSFRYGKLPKVAIEKMK